jgi:SPP1 family predicted phage head-tail adaptor
VNLNGKISNPGEMRTRIVLKKRTLTKASGFQSIIPVELATVWARWINAHGPEVWAAQSAQAVQAATVTIRYRSDVDQTCLVEKGGQDWEIVSVDNIQERNEYLELKVKLVTAG